ncbi:brachyurin-like [Wyeomyia smithii]|uniref:brachyurin-like n=1 Tax=Wyeomyia smithii TaxID=174621 RepID=UPI002467F4C6|nr:brachyurin-like [Wyeomyia smithii]
MKPLLLLLFILVVVTVNGVEIDWSKARPIADFDNWDELKEQLDIWRIPQHNPRIINGMAASIGQFPFQVSLYVNMGSNLALCGGSVLTQNYVLTAAHCVAGASGGMAIFGAYNRVIEDSQRQTVNFTASDVTIHLQYVVNSFLNDVATIRLNNPITYTDRIRPIRLPPPEEQRSFAGLEGTITGYGRTSADSQDLSEVLRYTSDSILTTTKCVEQWENRYITEQHICLSADNSRFACNGDSGGPLTVTENSQTLQVGIASFAATNCIGRPTVYTRVSYFLPWIEANSDYRSGGIHSAKLNSMLLVLLSCFFVHTFVNSNKNDL